MADDDNQASADVQDQPPKTYKLLSDGDETMKKIKHAFSTLLYPLKDIIIQVWAGTGSLLSTSNQPVAPADLEPHLFKYRSCSMMYEYSRSFDVGFSSCKNNIISNGLVSDAFNCFHPKVIIDLRVHKGQSPLVDCALECGLTSSVLIPVFATSNCCVGVVECCLKKADYILGLLNLLESAFKIVDVRVMSLLKVYQRWSLEKSIRDLNHDRAKLQIDDALKIVCETHNLPLGQVWISHSDNCNAPGLLGASGQSFVVRLSGYHSVVDSDEDAIKAYYDICTLPFEMNMTLPGRALQTNSPHFLLSMPCGSTTYSCFVICLNNSDYPSQSYAFEFIWPQRQSYLCLLESVLLKLMMCLPSFKRSPDRVALNFELSVLNVDNFAGHVSWTFNIFKDNRLSGIPIKPFYEESISSIPVPEVNQQYQSTIGDADTNPNAKGLSPNSFKGKSCISSDGPPPKRVKSDDKGDIIPKPFRSSYAMVVHEKEERWVFCLDHMETCTLARVKELIEGKLLLVPNSYKLTLDFGGELSSLISEMNFEAFKVKLRESKKGAFFVHVAPI